MGKVFVILLLVLGVWAATEFASGTSPFSTESRSSQATLAGGSGAKVQAAYDDGAERVEELLGE